MTDIPNNPTPTIVEALENIHSWLVCWPIASAEAHAAENAAAAERHDEMIAGLVSAATRSDLTNLERVGVERALEERPWASMGEHDETYIQQGEKMRAARLAGPMFLAWLYELAQVADPEDPADFLTSNVVLNEECWFDSYSDGMTPAECWSEECRDD